MIKSTKIENTEFVMSKDELTYAEVICLGEILKNWQNMMDKIL